jgi:hypothetical protein
MVTYTQLDIAIARLAAAAKKQKQQKPRRHKQQPLVTVFHDNAYGGTYVTAEGKNRMAARRNSYK